MNHDSQWPDWSRGGHTVPGGLDDLGRRTPRLTVFDQAFFETEPAPMDAGQLRRDSIAAASQAPRIPRIRHQPPVPDVVDRLESAEDAGHALVWLLCLAVLLVMVPALVIGVSWADVMDWLAMIGGSL